MMPANHKNKRLQRLVLYLLAFLLVIITFLLVFVNRFLEPVLRDRLHTLIIRGSDSLYTYQLGNLKTNFLSGNVEVENLQIKVDSNRYRQLEKNQALPSLTMQLHLVKGQVKGIALLALIFGKRIDVHEIMSKDADIKLSRHIHKDNAPYKVPPLWKALQPVIEGISIDRVNLDGIKLLYKNADTAEAVKLQFDRCIALFDDIRIDSAAAADTSRMGFTKEIKMQFNDLKFRTPDSSYKMKAEVIYYSSKTRTFEVVDFKIQPTLKNKDDFYKAAGRQASMQVITFDRARFTNVRLDQFIHNNMIVGDSVFIDRPDMDIYTDRTYPPNYKSKIGSYPHQHLLKANATIRVKGVVINNAAIRYTEKNAKTLQEGKLELRDLHISIANVTNDTSLIKKDAKCRLTASGKILGNSPLAMAINFYLDSANGYFDATGVVKNVTAAQLNGIAVPLANVRLQSFNMHQLRFAVKGNDYGASSDVRMRYNNLFVVLQKQDEETGVTETKKFMTKFLNKFTLYDDNPGPNGVERIAQGAQRSRLSSQAFFGILWKAIFAGMQGVMMKSGRYE